MEARAPFDVMLTGRFASSTTKSVSERAALLFPPNRPRSLTVPARSV